MKNLKTAALVILTTLAGGYASLAAATSQADWQSSTAVTINSSSTSKVSINAMSLIDNSELIRLQYGFQDLQKTLRIKSIVAQSGVKVSLSTDTLASLGADENGNPSLTLTFDVVSNGGFGVFPIMITLENTQTGQTTTLELMVSVQ